MSLHDQIEPPPGSACEQELVEKARKSPNTVTDEEWRQLLSSVQYQVARKHGTERAWSGRHNNEKRKGMYKCICCNADLFPSKYKFDSGSGWPSFYETNRHEDGRDNITRNTDNMSINQKDI